MVSFTEILWKLSFIAVVLCFGFTSGDTYAEYKTCCAIQTDCKGCNNLYKVNSITYCCPNCTGEVLVTALICECTVVVTDPRYAPNCTVSSKIVGDYYYGRTSWYSAANLPSISASALLVALSVAVLSIYRSAG